MSGLLDRIVATKRAEIAGMTAAEGKPTRAPCDVLAALRKPDALALIAEVKFRSPSAGPLSRALDAGERAVVYARGGAAMVSVLCDGAFFDGSWDDLARARAALDEAGFAAVPLLAKEFVIDPVQLDRARAAGADAALLIARILPGAALGRLAEECRARGLEPFVEVIDEAELARALDAGSRVVGVNARDLDTLAMDAASAARVVERIPKACVAVHLSGLRDEASIAAAAKTRADAALVGEALMRADHPGDLLKRMHSAALRR